MRAGEGVFDTIPIEADYTVGDMKLWLKTHKDKDPNEYDLVGPKGVWKMGAGSEVLGDDVLIADVMGPRFEGKWLMQVPKNAHTRGAPARHFLLLAMPSLLNEQLSPRRASGLPSVRPAAVVLRWWRGGATRPPEA